LLGDRITDALVDAATVGQLQSGPGVLTVRWADGALTWAYRPTADCTEDANEWAELRDLLTDYDPNAEVVIALIDGSPEFFRMRHA